MTREDARGLRAALDQDPCDWLALLAWADALLEEGRDQEARLYRDVASCVRRGHVEREELSELGQTILARIASQWYYDATITRVQVAGPADALDVPTQGSGYHSLPSCLWRAPAPDEPDRARVGEALARRELVYAAPPSARSAAAAAAAARHGEITAVWTSPPWRLAVYVHPEDVYWFIR